MQINAPVINNDVYRNISEYQENYMFHGIPIKYLNEENLIYFIFIYFDYITGKIY